MGLPKTHTWSTVNRARPFEPAFVNYKDYMAVACYRSDACLSSPSGFGVWDPTTLNDWVAQQDAHLPLNYKELL
jgi:hypothetical protein